MIILAKTRRKKIENFREIMKMNMFVGNSSCEAYRPGHLRFACSTLTKIYGTVHMGGVCVGVFAIRANGYV